MKIVTPPPRFLQDIPMEKQGALVPQYGEVWGSTAGLVGAYPTAKSTWYYGLYGFCGVPKLRR